MLVAAKHSLNQGSNEHVVTAVKAGGAFFSTEEDWSSRLILAGKNMAKNGFALLR
jgi:hypothetical protein